jgi:hypothetical protein
VDEIPPKPNNKKSPAPYLHTVVVARQFLCITTTTTSANMMKVPKFVSSIVKGIQEQLNFDQWGNYPQFQSNTVRKQTFCEKKGFCRAGMTGKCRISQYLFH